MIKTGPPGPGAAGGAVVILSGPPGAGKSTTAGAIAAASLRPAVHLHSDDFYDYIKSGFVPPWQPESQPQNVVVVGAIADAAFAYAGGGYAVLLDGVMGPWFLGPFRDRAWASGVPLHYMVLRPTLAETLRRARGRTAGEFRMSGPIRYLHQQFSGLGDLEGHVLDTTSLTAAQVTDAVLAALRSGQARLED
jgi:hypothetical protein